MKRILKSALFVMTMVSLAAACNSKKSEDSAATTTDSTAMSSDSAMMSSDTTMATDSAAADSAR
ncbi:hypothetical protein [Larkinella soli]|uniref:hypothetical protein n=1 Tax=Larkinella soli TaxID=1770527 RepID=UPI000FFC8C05|nr:hypothetical protein [Larkinella soli]